MPKMKTHRGAAKRVKKTGTGKIVCYHAYKSHILEKKSSKRKRALRKSAIMHTTDAKRIERLIAYVK
ncbi:50S ribosomal protein L35 [Dehalobacter sp. DCM]|uniref:50S ribosomal protein L35 n=1 Tax=Dehalobacter sp. DCM TaxID=2907827 RepID=UPI0030816ECC|nr:50S ribosomal protein L35 [Dehalobacter sp. DCM]